MLDTYRPSAPGDAAWDDRLVFWSTLAMTWSPEWDASDFAPDYSPLEMAQLGVFGDAYWGDAAGQEREALLPYCGAQLRRGDRVYTNIRGAQCARINEHGRPASLVRSWWLDRGLIFTPDPLGWYEWFCWYTLGRRIPGYDRHQIDRWINYRGRQLRMYSVRPYPGTAQALLHWGIAPRYLPSREETEDA